MEKFAGYGFNKSHAAAYALLAYHTAWLKVHYPAEFFAANMSVSLDDTDKLKIFYDDATQNFGIQFEMPDINQGRYRFEPYGPTSRQVRYGLGAIKGTGQGAIEAIVAAREEGGAFKSFFDFCARIDRSRVNKRVVEALIKAGAFDTLDANRASLMASVALGFEFADTQAANADQGGLFDFGDSHASSTREPDLVPAPAWSIKERLSLEKPAIGFFLSGHLFDEVEVEVRKFVPRRIADVSESREPQMLAGIVSDLRLVNGQRGRVAIFKLDDKTDTIESVANDELILSAREALKDDELVILQGKVQPDRFSGGLRFNVTAVWDLPAARCRFARHLKLPLNGALPALQALLREHPPKPLATEQGVQHLGVGVRLLVERPTARAELDLGESGRFYPSDEALKSWRKWAQASQIALVYE